MTGVKLAGTPASVARGNGQNRAPASSWLLEESASDRSGLPAGRRSRPSFPFRRVQRSGQIAGAAVGRNGDRTSRAIRSAACTCSISMPLVASISDSSECCEETSAPRKRERRGGRENQPRRERTGLPAPARASARKDRLRRRRKHGSARGPDPHAGSAGAAPVATAPNSFADRARASCVRADPHAPPPPKRRPVRRAAILGRRTGATSAEPHRTPLRRLGDPSLVQPCPSRCFRPAMSVQTFLRQGRSGPDFGGFGRGFTRFESADRAGVTRARTTTASP